MTECRVCDWACSTEYAKAERIAEIEEMPITYDEDSPKFTKEELQEFVPYHKEYFDITPKKRLSGQARQ
ncbi:MAG: hypothetical protein II973_11675 [Spirochaetaceae bacterium]|nr:hypothetical protein [Spirochaetaceae bacterium]